MDVQNQKDDGIQSLSDRQLPAAPDQHVLETDSFNNLDVALLETLLRELYEQRTGDTITLDQFDIWDAWEAIIEPDTGADPQGDDSRSAGDQQARPRHDVTKPWRPSDTQTFDDVQDPDPHSPEQNDFRTMRLQDRPRSLKRVIADASKKRSRAQVKADLFAALAETLVTFDESLLNRALDILKRAGGDAPASLINAVCQLATHPEMSVRRRAVYVLGETSQAELALSVLIQALGDPRYPVRRNAAVALGKLGDRRAVTALIPALQDTSKMVRREVVRSLGELGDERAENALRTALDDSDADVRLAVTAVLDRLEDKQDARPFTSAHDETKTAASQAPVAPVVRLVNEQTLDSLISGLKDDDPQVRAAAAAQLGRLGLPQAVEPLIDLLGDQRLSVREAAGKALQDLGELATDPLIAALNNRQGTVQRKAAQVLADTADAQMEKTFIAALESRDGAVKWEAIRALRSIDTPLAWEAVEQYRVRQQRRAATQRFLVRVLLPILALAAVLAVLVWMLLVD